jgi:hypothetical protein
MAEEAAEDIAAVAGDKRAAVVVAADMISKWEQPSVVNRPVRRPGTVVPSEFLPGRTGRRKSVRPV